MQPAGKRDVACDDEDEEEGEPSYLPCVSGVPAGLWGFDAETLAVIARRPELGSCTLVRVIDLATGTESATRPLHSFAVGVISPQAK